MWQPIRILETISYFQCSVDDSCISFHLYNLTEIWSELCGIKDVIQRAKDLNDGILYDDDTVLSTITTAHSIKARVGLPDSVQFLKLNYHVQGRPFNFQWKLSKLADVDIRDLGTYPVFLSIYHMSEKIEERKKIIKEMDIETGQNNATARSLNSAEISELSEELVDRRYSEVQKIVDGLFKICDEVQPHRWTRPNGSVVLDPTQERRHTVEEWREFFDRLRIMLERSGFLAHLHCLRGR